MAKKKKRKIKLERLFIVALFPALLVGGLSLIMFREPSQPKETRITYDKYDENILVEFVEKINADQYILSKNVEGTNRVIYGKDVDKKIYPASLTKLVTVAVALDNISDTKEKIKVEEKHLKGLKEANASVLYLNVGDEISLETALYGSALASGADCTNILKDYVESKGVDFIKEMNKKAKAIGMKNTNFTNVSGLHDANQYSTPRDIDTLIKYMYNNEKTRPYVTHFYETVDGMRIDATFYPYMDNFHKDNVEVLGGKSGYLPESDSNFTCVVKDKNGQLSFLSVFGVPYEYKEDKLLYAFEVEKIIDKYFKK